MARLPPGFRSNINVIQEKEGLKRREEILSKIRILIYPKVLE
jgi:hypothetical protein